MKEKELYFVPEVEILVMQSEGVICESPEPGTVPPAGNNNGGSY